MSATFTTVVKCNQICIRPLEKTKNLQGLGRSQQSQHWHEPSFSKLLVNTEKLWNVESVERLRIEQYI